MNNLKKVGLTALAGALVSVSANAAEVTMSGSASINFAGQEETTQGNGWTMSEGITFGMTGELDNGWTVSVSQVLNGDDVATEVFDTRTMTIDMADSGSLVFAANGGSSVLDAWDDVTPTAGEEAWDDVDGASAGPGGTGGGNMFTYSNSSLMDGVNAQVSYTPSNALTEEGSSSDYGITYTGVEGLTVRLGHGTDDSDTSATVETTIMAATYAMDAFTVGYQTSEDDSESSAADIDFEAFGISYAVSEELSVSINSSTHEYENTSLSDQEAMGISMSYVMGSMTLKANHNTVDNIAGAAANDRSGYSLNLAFAF
jgi:outer membrane protein OmpU